jgi:hypothetical protein
MHGVVLDHADKVGFIYGEGDEANYDTRILTHEDLVRAASGEAAHLLPLVLDSCWARQLAEALHLQAVEMLIDRSPGGSGDILYDGDLLGP